MQCCYRRRSTVHYGSKSVNPFTVVKSAVPLPLDELPRAHKSNGTKTIKRVSQRLVRTRLRHNRPHHLHPQTLVTLAVRTNPRQSPVHHRGQSTVLFPSVGPHSSGHHSGHQIEPKKNDKFGRHFPPTKDRSARIERARASAKPTSVSSTPSVDAFGVRAPMLSFSTKDYNMQWGKQVVESKKIPMISISSTRTTHPFRAFWTTKPPFHVPFI